MIRVMRWPMASSARVAEHALGLAIPRLDGAVERLADDDVLGRLDDGRQPRLRLDAPASVRWTSRKTSTAPTTFPAASRIGAALSSIGRSTPSRAISTVWLASPTICPSRSARSAGFSTAARVRLVDDDEDLGKRPADRLVTGQPVSARRRGSGR